MGQVALEMEPVKTATQVTHVGLLVDSSGSMARLTDAVVKNFNSQIEGIWNDATGHTDLSAWHFSNGRKRLYSGNVLHLLLTETLTSSRRPSIERSGYRASGNTGLYDAVLDACEELNGGATSNDSYLLIVLTDGEENDSLTSRSDFSKRLLSLQATDRWTIVFQVPPGHKQSAIQYGVPEDNIREWEATSAGLAETVRATRVSTQSYFSARAAGATSVKNFYQPDLSSLGTAELKRVLDDVRDQYHRWTVDKECAIADFVGYKSGRPYVPGSTFYQLTKPEAINSDREVLVEHRSSGAIYGGNAARNVLGMPSGNGVVVKFKPGNYADYAIYAQSKSTNRKLVRGTVVLVKK